MSCRRSRDRACRQAIRGLPTELSRESAGRIVKRQGGNTGKRRSAGLSRERAGRIVKRQGRQTDKKEGGQAAKQVKRQAARLERRTGKKEGEADA